MSPPPNHDADIQNPNKGTPGTNIIWDKAQGNRSKQMNPNQRPDSRQHGSRNRASKGPPLAARRRREPFSNVPPAVARSKYEEASNDHDEAANR